MGRGDGYDDAAGALRGLVREAGECLVLDGALGTELEAHGADLQDELWSASCLVSAPHIIRKVRSISYQNDLSSQLAKMFQASHT